MRLLRVLTVLAVLPALAHAQQASVRAEAETRRVDCAGGDASVQGNRNALTFTGACRSLTLRGDANTVMIEMAASARIDVEGNGNRLRYAVAGGGAAPSVRVSGSDTALEISGSVAASAAPAGDGVVLRLGGDAQSLDVDCAGRDVDIQGNRSRYTLRGGCRSVVAHGDANTIAAALAPDARIEIEGNGTVLTYTQPRPGPEPAVTVRGHDSRALPKPGGTAVAVIAPAPAYSAPPPATPPPPAAPPPPQAAALPNPPTLVSVPVLMHALGGVVVADGTQVMLPAIGLFDDADLLIPNAETKLAALASLARQTHASRLEITGSDPADATRSAKRAEAVRVWFGAHGLNLPATSSSAVGDPAQITILLGR